MRIMTEYGFAVLGGLATAASVAGLLLAYQGVSGLPPAAGDALVRTVTVIKRPRTYSPAAERGIELFRRGCASCHGELGVGAARGPSLMLVMYGQERLSDRALRRAITDGAAERWWTMGDMPPSPGLTASQIDAVIRFLRETQRANGIH